MASSTAPIFRLKPKHFTGKTITAANTGLDGVGSNILTFLTAATITYVDYVRIKPLGTNVETLIRIYLALTASNTTAASNSLLFELNLPATTVSTTNQPLPQYIWRPEALCVDVGYELRAGIYTAVAAGILVTPQAAVFE